MRPDLIAIQDRIKAGSRVLDLGCGDGSLLEYLQEHKQVKGYGLEIDADGIQSCVVKGVNVIEQDLDSGLGNFDSQSFDLVVMTQALQAVKFPDKVLDEMLRVGKESIITFPNFGHWRCRAHLLLKGKMPVSDSLPYSWYDTPNIHLCTFRDFEALCRHKNIQILHRAVVDHDYEDSILMKLLPNWFGEVAIYHVAK